jgi:iron complex outermembrane receptor protein
MKTNRLVTALLCSAAMSAVSSAALAQSAQTAEPQADDAAAVQDVVVTGSRVIRNGNNSPSPVTVVQTEELLNLQPTTITDALNNLPVFQGSRGQFSNPNTTGLYGGGNPASNQLNLRNLGSQRTLVLFDGQRLPPSNAIGIVDVDMVPQMLIQRVDVVTGGASAVYGSDAIAGVVNYITDKNFNGLKAEAGYGISERDDSQTWKFGLAGGTRFLNDRGHVEASYNHYEDEGLPRRNMRDYYQYALLGSTPGSTAVAGSVTNPYSVYNGVRNASSSFGGLITNGTLRGYNFTTDGGLVPFVHGALTGTANQEVGGDGSYGGQNSLKAPLTFDQVFGRFDYDFSDSLRFHAEASGNWKTAVTNAANTQFTNLTFSRTNAFLSPATQPRSRTTS